MNHSPREPDTWKDRARHPLTPAYAGFMFLAGGGGTLAVSSMPLWIALLFGLIYVGLAVALGPFQLDYQKLWQRYVVVRMYTIGLVLFGAGVVIRQLGLIAP